MSIRAERLKEDDKAFRAAARGMGLKMIIGTAVNAVFLLLLPLGGFAAFYFFPKKPLWAITCGLLSISDAILWWRLIRPWAANLRRREARCPVCGGAARVTVFDELVCSGCDRTATTNDPPG